MRIRGSWARIPDVSGRFFIFGPFLGRLYCLEPQPFDRQLERILGLGSFGQVDAIVDPVDEIVHDRTTLGEGPDLVPPLRYRLAYRLLAASRRVVPFAVTTTLVCWAGTRSTPGRQSSLSEIARTVRGIEQATGMSDCYPRAFMTALLVLQSGYSCRLVVGALTPTRLVHVWASVGGRLPYEPLPEHYMYQPLLALTLSR